MLLSYNTDKVIELLINFDNLKSIDKLRFSIYLMDNLEFKTSFNIRDKNILLKKILANLDKL